MEKQVTIYTTPTCHYCQAAKDFFASNNIEFAEIDVATDTEAREKMVEMTGQLGVPVIQIGDEAIVGFDEEKLKEMLALS